MALTKVTPGITSNVADGTLSNLTDVESARNNLNLGSVATYNVGSNDNDIPTVADINTIVQNIGYTGSITGSGSFDWVVQTSAYTAQINEKIIADTSGGSFTITLPANPSAGNFVQITDGAAFSTNNLTVARNNSTIETLTEDVLLTISGSTYEFIFDGTTWHATAAIATIGYTGSQGNDGIGTTGYTGSSGDLGYTGSQGNDGIGTTGYTGSSGDLGYTGSQGNDGIGTTGYTGSSGDLGYTGSVGYDGSQGTIGYTGSSGDLGYTGSVGYDGSQGTIGYTGSSGDLGYTGSQGNDGIGTTGYTGSSGQSSFYGFFPGTTSTTISSLRRYLSVTSTIHTITAWGSVAGTADAIITLNKNGSSAGTVTIIAGQLNAVSSVSISVTPSDYFTIDLVGGGGIQDVGVRIDF